MSTTILQIATQYSIYSGCIIAIMGILGNILNIIIFTQLKSFRNNRGGFYITMESISNFFYQFISISLTILTIIYGDDGTSRSSIWCKFRYILSQSLVLTTLSMICSSAIDQFFSTNYWFYRRQTCSMKLARCITFVLICFWIIHSIIFGLSFDAQPSVGCVISNSNWLQYSTYFFYPVLVGLLPIVIASFFSILAFQNVRRIVRRQIPIIRRRLDKQMTAMILIRVIFYVFSTSPYSIYRAYIINHPPSRNQPIEYAIGRLIQAIFVSFVSLNYTISFYLFMISSSRFRHQVKYVLVKKCWQSLKSCCCFNLNRVAAENRDSHGVNVDLDDDA